MAERALVNVIGMTYQRYEVCGTEFEVPATYKPVLDVQLNGGVYGVIRNADAVICCAQNETTGEQVAIKKIEGVFDLRSSITLAKHTLRELRILRQLCHENIIGIQEIFIPLDRSDFSDVYVVYTLMETNLTSIISSDEPLSSGICQFFLYQILRGCKYFHSANIIHRDLKPQKLLVNSNCDLRIGDFGSARVAFSSGFQSQPLTEYVCTRWYRAPEILCCWSHYTAAIDVWAIGCIFAEMLKRSALFPGRNTKHQLELVLEKLGPPQPAEIACIENATSRKFIESYSAGHDAGPTLNESLPGASPEEVELVKAMLRFSPTRRVTSEEAIRCAYMAEMHSPDDEPTRGPLDESLFEFEQRKLGIDELLRAELFDEYLVSVNEEVRQQYYTTHEKHDIIACRILQDG